MKAMVIDRFGSNDELHEAEVETPQPRDNEILIKIAYAGVNPVDWKIREGYLQSMMEHRFPLILGWDAAGEVAATGPNASSFRVGEKVMAYCRKPVVQAGTFAEYVAVESDAVAKAPKSIGLREASGLPLAGLTAWQALFDFANLSAGQTVLVHAGAGGVGGFGLQFAKHAKAKVFTTASSAKHAYVRELGADVAIDYREQSFVDAIREAHPEGVDVVFDCVGGETQKQSFDIVKEGGVLVSIVDTPDEDRGRERGIKTGFVFVSPNGAQLSSIAQLVDQGVVRPPDTEEYPLSRAAQALEKNQTGRTQGKLVLKVS